tara:strand:+ start:1820 stop:2539 length:720 start_codon:yes stop_codon:yes gene_type:complete
MEKINPRPTQEERVNIPVLTMSRDELVDVFMYLPRNVSKGFSSSEKASGALSREDIIQESYLALLNAIDNINYDIISKSSIPYRALETFLHISIRGALRRVIDQKRGLIRLPEYVINEMRVTGDESLKDMYFNSSGVSMDGEYIDERLFSVGSTSDGMLEYLNSVINDVLDKDEAIAIKVKFGLYPYLELPKANIAEALGWGYLPKHIQYHEVNGIIDRGIAKLKDAIDIELVVDFLNK